MTSGRRTPTPTLYHPRMEAHILMKTVIGSLRYYSEPYSSRPTPKRGAGGTATIIADITITVGITTAGITAIGIADFS
jgi:hypothetical protein